MTRRSRVRGWAGALVGGPAPDGATAHTYRCHLGFALCDAAAAGILANAPLMAVKGHGARDWHLTVPLFLSSFGMLATVGTSQWAARGPTRPFILAPTLVLALSSFALVLAPGPFWFLLLLGVGMMFEVSTRPALAAFIRLNYPVTERGAAVGAIRQGCSLVFLGTNLLSAAALDLAPKDPRAMVMAQACAAGLFSLLGFASFRRVRAAEEPTERAESGGSRSGAVRILRADGRFRTYLAGCFLFGFTGLLYVSFLPAFLAHDLGFGYVEAALLEHVIPSVAAYMLTGRLGRWFDRTNPLIGWAVVRLGWGLDPLILAAAPLTAGVGPGAAFLTCAAGRACRGSVMGGSYILWWQLGANYFARSAADTARYTGLLTGLNGVMRLAASLGGVALISALPRPGVLLVGGLGVLLSSLQAWAQGRSDSAGTGFRTFADVERGKAAPVGD